MLMTKFPMTATGAEQLREELKKLKRVERPAISKAIAEARSHGDLSENAEYDAAKQRQGLIEARIRYIESKLSNAQIIDVTQYTHMSTIIFGATVNLLNVEAESIVTYQIVGEDEANLKHGKISIQSPIARALIGKIEGEVIEVKTPIGYVEYEVKEIKFI